MAIWNEVAPRYHKRWASEDIGPFASTKKLVNSIGIKKGNKVLDVACGTGVVTKKITQKVGKTGYVVGADTSVTAIKIAKKWNENSSNLLFVNADAENFTFSEKFDIITCQYALFFFPNASKALKNMRKSLKKSGKLGMSVHGHKDKVPYFGNILDAVTQFIPEYVPPGTPDLDRYGTKKSFRDEVIRAGFSNVKVKDYTFKYSPGTFDDYWKNYLKYVAKPIKEKLNSLSKPQRRELKEMIKENTKLHTKRNGMIEFPWEVLILTAKY
ncbi:methyltransferase domain-containing protein [Nitrosopumilus sp.]|uniref:methyltransferase domain-containing protein n=1 Tax=Nitrosopumilus sp. TaxID=2024843 RepID=UPI00247EEE25|nr:methyltransferase domain-containing protein [Nitrosopumilus sp.]